MSARAKLLCADCETCKASRVTQMKSVKAMTTEYVTKHYGCAAFLRYVLGDESHVSTMKFEHGMVMSFNDPDNKCEELQRAFFSTEGAAVGDAKALLDCSRELTNTIFEAKRNGIWERS